jgi:hypothetical protein
MEPEAQRFIAESLHRNFIDHAEYPQTADIEQRCIRMLARLHPLDHKRVKAGTGTDHALARQRVPRPLTMFMPSVRCGGSRRRPPLPCSALDVDREQRSLQCVAGWHGSDSRY